MNGRSQLNVKKVPFPKPVSKIGNNSFESIADSLRISPEEDMDNLIAQDIGFKYGDSIASMVGGRGTILLMPFSKFKGEMNSLQIHSNRFINFKHQYTSSLTSGKIICKDTEIPFGDYGLTINPVMQVPDCLYYEFNCNSNTDHNGAFKEESVNDNISL